MDSTKNLKQDVLSLLEKIEYVIDYGVGKKYCPLCEEPESMGHKPDCEVLKVKNSLVKELHPEFK